MKAQFTNEQGKALGSDGWRASHDSSDCTAYAALHVGGQVIALIVGRGDYEESLRRVLDTGEVLVRIINSHDDLVRDNNELRDQVKSLIEALKPLIEIAEEHCDAGPPGEGWKSDELLAKIAFANAALAAAGAA